MAELIKNSVSLDMNRFGINRVEAMQGDTARVISAKLFTSGRTWTVPDGVSMSLAFLKPDGVRGRYDQMPDGSPAFAVNGNEITVKLAGEVLSVPGDVLASIILQNEQMQEIATFPFTISVVRNPGAGAEKSNNYFDFRTMYLDQNFAPVIRNTKKGNPVTLDMVSTVPHKVTLGIEGSEPGPMITMDIMYVNPESGMGIVHKCNMTNLDPIDSQIIEDGKVWYLSTVKYSRGLGTTEGLTVAATYNLDTKQYIEKIAGGGAGSAVINDTVISADSVWSSQKTQEILADVIPEGVAAVESGNEISCDIVSSFNHSVECRVSRVNLLDNTKSINGYQTNGTPSTTGYRVKGNWYAELSIKGLTSGTKYFLSYTSEIITGSVKRVVVKNINTQGQELAQFKNGTGGEFIPISDTICIMFYVGNGAAGEIDFKHLMLSTEQKAYVPYIPKLSALQVTQTGTGAAAPKVFPVGENGAVIGIRSISPQMSIKLANTGAVLDVKYYKDTKKYIDRKFAQIRADIDYVAAMQGVAL